MDNESIREGFHGLFSDYDDYGLNFSERHWCGFIDTPIFCIYLKGCLKGASTGSGTNIYNSDSYLDTLILCHYRAVTLLYRKHLLIYYANYSGMPNCWDKKKRDIESYKTCGTFRFPRTS